MGKIAEFEFLEVWKFDIDPSVQLIVLRETGNHSNICAATIYPTKILEYNIRSCLATLLALFHFPN